VASPARSPEEEDAEDEEIFFGLVQTKEISRFVLCSTPAATTVPTPKRTRFQTSPSPLPSLTTTSTAIPASSDKSIRRALGSLSLNSVHNRTPASKTGCGAALANDTPVSSWTAVGAVALTPHTSVLTPHTLVQGATPLSTRSGSGTSSSTDSRRRSSGFGFLFQKVNLADWTVAWDAEEEDAETTVEENDNNECM